MKSLLYFRSFYHLENILLPTIIFLSGLTFVFSWLRSIATKQDNTAYFTNVSKLISSYDVKVAAVSKKFLEAVLKSLMLMAYSPSYTFSRFLRSQSPPSSIKLTKRVKHFNKEVLLTVLPSLH